MRPAALVFDFCIVLVRLSCTRDWLSFLSSFTILVVVLPGSMSLRVSSKSRSLSSVELGIFDIKFSEKGREGLRLGSIYWVAS